LTLIYYALIAIALIFLVGWAWRAFLRLYETALKWTEQI